MNIDIKSETALFRENVRLKSEIERLRTALHNLAHAKYDRNALMGGIEYMQAHDLAWKILLAKSKETGVA